MKNDLSILLPDNQHLSVELKVQSLRQGAAFIGTIFRTDITKVQHLFDDGCVGACGIMVINRPETIAEFDQNLLGADTAGLRGLGRLPQNAAEILRGGNVSYWWDLKVNPATGKAIVSLESTDVLVKWVGRQPDLFEIE